MPALNDEDEEPIAIPYGDVKLLGNLAHVGPKSRGIVIFAHGSGSSRNSPRNAFVAHFLQNHGFSTLLFDLLTEDEEIIDLHTQHLRFDIPMLAKRLEAVTEWVLKQPHIQELPLAYFGASTGAGAALMASTTIGDAVKTIVSRGGRPDLAEQYLPLVSAPTLLIVGSQDKSVIDLNMLARSHMRPGLAKVELIAGASHLFAEPGTLEKVATMAVDWLGEHLDVDRKIAIASSKEYEPRI